MHSNDSISLKEGRVRVLVFFALVYSAQMFGATLINFDNLPSGPMPKNQYGGVGVTFESGISPLTVGTTPPAHSLTKVLTVSYSGAEFDPYYISLDFTTPQSIVSLYAGTISSPGATFGAVLTVYDQNYTEILHSDPVPVTADACATFLQIITNNAIYHATIRMIVYDSGHPAGVFTPFAIDDVSFDTTSPGCPPVACTVTIDPLPDSGYVDASVVTISGTVSPPHCHLPRPFWPKRLECFQASLALQRHSLSI